MTPQKLQRILTKINPKLRLRRRFDKGGGDVVGVFVGMSGKSGYLLRMNKGDVPLTGHRFKYHDPQRLGSYTYGRIQKRGRKTVVTLLKNYGWIKTQAQRSAVLWGLESRL